MLKIQKSFQKRVKNLTLNLKKKTLLVTLHPETLGGN